jgi:hypothetical protein
MQMLESAVAKTPSSSRVRAALQRDIARVCGQIDSLDRRARQTQSIADPGKRRMQERMLELESRQLKDQLKNLRETQDTLHRR